MIHLVSTAQAVRDAGIDFFFTDGHGTMGYTTDYVGLARLGEVDWDVIPLRQWSNTVQDPDRKRRKQAEFLVHDVFPFELVQRIGVYSHTVKLQVEQVLEDLELEVPVSVEFDWYYS